MTQTQLIMGMPVTISVAGSLPGHTKLVNNCFEWFRQVDQLFSTYKPDSEISRLNSGELSYEGLSPEVRGVLKLSDKFKESTQGYFDPQRNGRLDPSGIVKGWSIAKAAAILSAGSAENYYIEAGGDITARGTNDKGEYWRVGIKFPPQPAKYAKVVELKDCAIATSGEYERGRHIYNPHGRLSPMLSATVIGPDITTADALATAVFAMGGDKGIALLRKFPGYEGYAMLNETEALATPGFDNFLSAKA